MARLVRVFVRDRSGRGIPGERVKVYGGPELKTDREGVAEFLVNASKVAVYVNGSTVYDGWAAGLPSSGIITYTKS